jgi:hypothetical protein
METPLDSFLSGTGASALLDRLVLSVMRTRGIFRAPEVTRKEADLYLDPALLGSPERFFPRPPPLSHVEVRAHDERRWRMRFASEYTTHDRSYQAEHDSFAENRTVHVEAWLHATPRPAMIALHPWFSGYSALDAQIFGAQRLYDRGMDVYLLTTPFHGARTPRGSLSGWQFVPPNVRNASEAVRQAVWDARRLLGWVRRRGNMPVGAMGASLGGGFTALLAALEPDLAFAIPVLPLVSIGEMIWRGSGAPREARAGLEAKFAAVSALSYPCVVPRERLLVLGGRGDRIISPEHVRALWRHWGSPSIHWTDGGHLLHFGRSAAMRAVEDHLARVGMMTPEVEEAALPVAA